MRFFKIFLNWPLSLLMIAQGSFQKMLGLYHRAEGRERFASPRLTAPHLAAARRKALIGYDEKSAQI
jgi:hypothetical protein